MGGLNPELNHPARRSGGEERDEAGEWYFDKKIGRLYLWPKESVNLNRTRVEVARHLITLDLVGARHVEVSGLTFTGGNSIDPKKAVDVGEYKIPEHFAVMPAIRLLGDCRSIHISNIAVTQTAGGGIANMVTSKDDLVSDIIRITDTEFSRDAVPPTQCERKGPPITPYNIRCKSDSIRDYHWSAALTACLLLE